MFWWSHTEERSIADNNIRRLIKQHQHVILAVMWLTPWCGTCLLAALVNIHDFSVVCMTAQ